MISLCMIFCRHRACDLFHDKIKAKCGRACAGESIAGESDDDEVEESKQVELKQHDDDVAMRNEAAADHLVRAAIARVTLDRLGQPAVPEASRCHRVRAADGVGRPALFVARISTSSV